MLPFLYKFTIISFPLCACGAVVLNYHLRKVHLALGRVLLWKYSMLCYYGKWWLKDSHNMLSARSPVTTSENKRRFVSPLWLSWLSYQPSSPRGHGHCTLQPHIQRWIKIASNREQLSHCASFLYCYPRAHSKDMMLWKSETRFKFIKQSYKINPTDP